MEIEQITTKGPAFAPAHPGEILREDVLPALEMSKTAFAEHLGISRNTLYKLLNEEQPVTLELAIRLGQAFGNGARFWLALQVQHDLWTAEREARIDVKPLKQEVTGGPAVAKDVRSSAVASTAAAGLKKPARLTPSNIKKVSASALAQKSGLSPATRRDKKRSQ